MGRRTIAEVTLNFQDAEKTYRDLEEQHAAGKLTDEDFEAKVAELWCQDAQGRWWLLGVETGEWYMHDGQQWIKATPPASEAPAALPPAPEAPAAPLPPADSGAVMDSGAAQRNERGSVLPPRLFVAAPAGRGNAKGLSTSMLIGIIAVIAVVAILIVVGGFFVIRGALGGLTARATTTPTRSLALVPSPDIPTFTLVVPTDTPLPPPTIEATPTRAVATRRPASPTPTGPTATATLNVPPGVYVTNIETIPSKVNIGDTIGFKVSFLNTTGTVQTYNWYVKWYQCPEQCQDFRHSQGETLQMNSNLTTGTMTLSTTQNVDLRAGIRCDLIAIATYLDPVNQLPTPFQATKDNGHFSFTPCH